MASSSSSDLQLLLYDNRHTPGAAFKPTDLLYRSAAALAVPMRIGHLAPASERPWQAGDREEWVLRTLPELKAQTVVLLDATDAVLFCGAAELRARLERLARNASAFGRGHVIVGAEAQLWPEEQSYALPTYSQRPIGCNTRLPHRRSSLWATRRAICTVANGQSGETAQTPASHFATSTLASRPGLSLIHI